MTAATPAPAAGATPAARLLGVLGAMLVLGYAVFAVLQIQVLNPLATVPGSSLREIHAAVGRTADTMGWGLMFAVLLPGPLVAVGAALSALRGRAGSRAVLIIDLSLLALGSFAYFAASFPAGMTLADTFGVGGADHAPWARVLHAVSGIAALALAATVIHGAVRGSRAGATPAPRPA